MPMPQSLPIDLHTGDCLAKARALKGRAARSRSLPLVIAIVMVIILAALLPREADAADGYQLPVTVESGDAARVDLPVDVPVDLTVFLGGFGGTLDPASLRVIEVDSTGAALDSSVLFQFDPAPGFDPASHPVGTLVFVMNDTTPAMSSRAYRLLFDVVGGCPECPAPPVVPAPVTVDSLSWENQDTYLVSTPRGDYYYHRAGAGLASLVDNDAQDWIGFHDVPWSGSSGEYRGIPNMVFTNGDPSASFFHPGFTNATTELVSAGPLKVSLRSVTNDPANEWIVRWDFYAAFARMTVEQTGTSNGGDYWFLYEGTPGGGLDAGDIVVRADGDTTSAFDGNWETTPADPQWVYLRDTAAARYLFFSDDAGDTAPDSYRSMGPYLGAPSDMTILGLGRVLETSAGSLIPRMSGADRSFTLGFGEDAAYAAADIAGATAPVTVTLGTIVDLVSAVGDDLPRRAVLRQNHPNPFNPVTRIGFSLPQAGPVRLAVYDAQGRLVRTLLDGRLGAGDHAATWDGRTTGGTMAASAVYLYRLETADGVRTGKMTLVE